MLFRFCFCKIPQETHLSFHVIPCPSFPSYKTKWGGSVEQRKAPAPTALFCFRILALLLLTVNLTLLLSTVNLMLICRTTAPGLKKQCRVSGVKMKALQKHYSGFGFRPHMGTSEIFVPEGPKSQAGSRTGRLDLPTKCQGPFSE
jgi:hypothetical protein